MKQSFKILSLWIFMTGLILPVLFAEQGIDPLNQQWVNQENMFGVNPGQESILDQQALSILKKVKAPRQMTKKNWSAPAPPPLNEYNTIDTDTASYTRFADVEAQLINVNKQVYGGQTYQGEFKDYTEVFINGIAFEVKGQVSFDIKTGNITHLYTLKEPVSYPTKYGNMVISGWAGFSPEGKVNFVCPNLKDRDFKIGDLSIPYKIVAGKYLAKIFFHNNGNISSLHIAEDLRLNTYNNSILYEHHEGCGGDLSFYKNEKFRGGYLAENTLIKGVYYPKGAYIEFWDNGQLRAAVGNKKVWNETLTIQGVKVGTPELGGGIVFTREGKLASVFGFAEDTTIYEKTFKQGQSMKHYFNADGKLITWAADITPGQSFYIIDPEE